MRNEMIEDGRTQPEAFNLMKYACEEGHHLTIWNSRDGVTPFIICCPVEGCGFDSRHVDWDSDVYAPSHVPKTGDYVFVDLTIEIARAGRFKYVETYWDDQMKEMYGSKKVAVERLANGDLGSFAHAPHLTRWE